MTEDTKRRKTGGRPPKRGDLHHVTVTQTESEHQMLRMAAAHAGTSAGELVARWSRRYLARHGIRVNALPDDVTDKEEAR